MKLQLLVPSMVLSLSCGRSPLTKVVAQVPIPIIDPTEISTTVGELVVLSGGGSYDSLKEPLTFNWRLASAPTGHATTLDIRGESLARLTPDQIGKWVVELTVHAGEGSSDRVSEPVTATITVTDPSRNRPPDARAPSSLTAVRGTRVRLDGSLSSDPDGDALTFRWRAVSAPAGTSLMLTDATKDIASFQAETVGSYGFELTVTDPGLLTGSTRCNVTVTSTSTGVDSGVVVIPPVGDAGILPGPLDPSEVYLAGTLSEGACYLDALTHWSTPNVASTGFDCYFDSQRAVIRPTDGRLIYTNVFENVVREYHCDDCLVTKGSMWKYPSGVLNNDTIITTPCPGTAPKVASFKISPDGELLYQCQYNSPEWRDASGAVVYNSMTDGLFATGASGWVLTATRVMNLKTSIANTITGLPHLTSSWRAIRWTTDGFWVSVALGGSGGAAQLWKISTSGAAQLVGDYPPYPPMISARYDSKLDGSGRLFSMASDNSETFLDVIVRRELGKSTEVIYSEKSDPLVKIHISYLVTGP